MPNLVSALKELKAEKKKIENEYKAKIQGYNIAIKALEQLNDTCERCEGVGKVLRPRACAEDDRPDPADPKDYIPCPECHGTGKVTHVRVMDEDTAKGFDALRQVIYTGGEKVGDLQFR